MYPRKPAASPTGDEGARGAAVNTTGEGVSIRHDSRGGSVVEGYSGKSWQPTSFGYAAKKAVVSKEIRELPALALVLFIIELAGTMIQ